MRLSWCLSIILARFRCILLCLSIQDVIPFAADKSSALRVARTMWSTYESNVSSASSCGMLSKEEVISPSCTISSLSLRSCGLATVVSSFGSLSESCGSSSATFVHSRRSQMRNLFLSSLFVCMTILVFRRRVGKRFFFICSSIVQIFLKRRRERWCHCCVEEFESVSQVVFLSTPSCGS